jgi:hypothetical protein
MESSTVLIDDKDVRINEKIMFEVDDVGMAQLVSLLARVGILKMDCPGCGLTIIPQVRAHYFDHREEEFEVGCVGCKKMVGVRFYGGYGFLL